MTDLHADGVGATEAALADTRDEALREYDYRQCPVCARAVLAAVPPQQGAPADTDARPANNAGTRGGGT